MRAPLVPLRHSPIPSFPVSCYQTGSLLRLPAEGTLYVLADLHNDLDLFERFNRQERFEKRVARGKHVYLLSLGDIVDSRRDTPRGTGLAERLATLKRDHPDNVHVLMGNHEAAALFMHYGLTGAGLEDAVDRCRATLTDNDAYHTSAYWARKSRLAPSMLARAPLVAVSQNGLVFAHAGPLCSPEGAEYVAALDPLVVARDSTLAWFTYNRMHSPDNPGHDLLWSRAPTQPRKAGRAYSTEDVSRFVKRMGGFVLFVGHEQGIKGYCTYGKRLAILETATSEAKPSYLCLPLDPEVARYTSTADITKAELRRISR